MIGERTRYTDHIRCSARDVTTHFPNIIRIVTARTSYFRIIKMWKLHAIWFHTEVSNQFHAPVGSISVKEHVPAMTLAMVRVR